MNINNIQDILFITYQLNQDEHEFNVSYCGCREIVIPDYKRPSYIKGMIELEGKYIPVIDPSIYYRSQPIRLNNLACILVVRHVYRCRSHRTGILMEDIEEVINLTTGSYKNMMMRSLPFNVRFVVRALKKACACKLLSNTHASINLCEQQKQASADFVAFSEIVSRDLAHV